MCKFTMNYEKDAENNRKTWVFFGGEQQNIYAGVDGEKCKVTSQTLNLQPIFIQVQHIFAGNYSSNISSFLNFAQTPIGIRKLWKRNLAVTDVIIFIKSSFYLIL